MDPEADHLVSLVGRKKMVLSPAKTNMRDNEATSQISMQKSEINQTACTERNHAMDLFMIDSSHKSDTKKGF